MLTGGCSTLVMTVGVSLSDKACFPSSNTGLFVVLVTFITLPLIVASVGGGQLLFFIASTIISWSGSSVLTNKWSPGNIIFLAFIEMSGLLLLASGCVIVL